MFGVTISEKSFFEIGQVLPVLRETSVLPVNRGQIEGLRVGDIFAAEAGSFGLDHPSSYLQMIPPIE